MTTTTEQKGGSEIQSTQKPHKSIKTSSPKYKSNYLSKNNHIRHLVRSDNLFNRRIIRFGMILPFELEFIFKGRTISEVKKNCSKLHFEIIKAKEPIDIDFGQNDYRSLIEEYHLPIAERSVDFELIINKGLYEEIQDKWPTLIEDNLHYNKIFNNKLFE